MEKELRNTREIIEQEYGEFPETILHAELCRACARVDGRSIKQSLRPLHWRVSKRLIASHLKAHWSRWHKGAAQ